MVSHIWSARNDWEYCTLENCKIVNTNVMLDNAITGTITSDIRDSSSRIFDYNELVPVINVPVGSSALLYIRSGWYPEYYADSWTDWTLINEPIQRMEYTLSLSTTKISADYDIKSLSNIYYAKNYKFQELATNLKTIYLATLNQADVESNDLYSSLWSAKVDDAIVDFAKVDYDGDALTPYATDASFVNNIFILKNPLPDDNVIVIVKYVPRYFVYSAHPNRYFQFKLELTVDPVIWRTATNDDYLTSDGDQINLGAVGPTVSSITMNYTLDYQKELEKAFPRFYRRL